MPIITFCSPKGGCGKTTAATILACTLAGRGSSVSMIDADPNHNVVDWANLPGKPDGIEVVGEVGEETIVDAIEAAGKRAAFVIVDLPGTASLLVAYATAMADLVLIPVQASGLDARQAARMIRLIKSQEKVSGRAMPFAVLLNRTSVAIVPKTQRFLEARFAEMAVPVLATRLYDRQAFRDLFSYGGTLAALQGVSNLAAAIHNATEFTAEIIARLSPMNKQEVA